MKCCQKFAYSSPLKFLSSIESGRDPGEQSFFIQHVVVEESYFFRDEKQTDFLRNEFLPELIRKKRALNDKNIRIWSAGCSNGQEIYSIGILLHQLLSDYDSWNLQLVGTDINQQALADALEARYSKWEIRTSQEFIENSGYFQKISDNCFQIQAFIKKKAQFYYLNLMEDSYPSIMNGTYNVDLILCRNVFIYFNQQIIEHACCKFSEALANDGVLLLSATDPVNLPNAPLTINIQGGVTYFKAIAYLPDRLLSTKKKTSIQAKSFTQAYSSNKDELKQRKQEIILALKTGAWEQVLTHCLETQQLFPDDSELYQFQAKALVNLGNLQDAKTTCEKSIQLNALEPHSYLLLGIIELQSGAHDQAEVAFKKTLFLNSEFMEAHYQLGQIMLYKGNTEQAMKYIRNALKLAEQGNPVRPVHNVFSLTYAGFAEMLKNELSVHQRWKPE